MALQVWLPLLGDTTNQGLDNHVFSNTGTSYVTVDNNGKIGKCFKSIVPAGAHSGIYSGDGGFMEKYINNKSWTLCAWVNTTCASSTPVICLSYGLLFFVGTAANTIIRLYNSARNLGWSSSVGVNDGKWHHVAATYNVNTNKVKIYVDGINTGNGDYPAGYKYASSWNNGLFIGRNPNNSTLNTGYFYDGKVNDVRIYDHCLSNKEIKEISKALIVHYPLDFNGRPKDNIVAGTKWDEQSWTYPASSYSDKFSATTSIVPSASQYVLSFYAKSTVDKDKIRCHWYSPNTTTKCETNQGTVTTAVDGAIDFIITTSWKRYWCIYTQSSTTAVKHLICPRLWSGQGTGTVSIKGIKIEEGTIPTPWMPNSGDNIYSVYNADGTKVYDTSGYCRYGTITGSLLVSNDTKRYLVGTNFNQSGYIINSNFNVNMDSFTLNLWIKPKAMTTSQHFLFGTFTSWTGHGIGIWRDSGSPAKYNLLVKSDAASSYANNPIYLTLDSWNMITMVYNGTSVTGYLNGTQYYTVSYGSNGNITNPNLMLGNSKYNSTAASENDEAIMSDFRLYATALSAKDVQELYNSPISIGDNGSMIIEGSFDEN